MATETPPISYATKGKQQPGHKFVDLGYVRSLLLTSFGLIVILTISALVFPVYTANIKNPNTFGNTIYLEEPYTFRCYGLSASTTLNLCPPQTGWNACYVLLEIINHGNCGTNHMPIGSEDLEPLSKTLDTSILLMLVFELSAFVPLAVHVMYGDGAYNISKKITMLYISALLNILCCLAAVMMIFSAVQSIDNTSHLHGNGLEHKATFGPSVIIMPAIPLFFGMIIVLMKRHTHSEIE